MLSLLRLSQVTCFLPLNPIWFNSGIPFFFWSTSPLVATAIAPNSHACVVQSIYVRSNLPIPAHEQLTPHIHLWAAALQLDCNKKMSPEVPVTMSDCMWAPCGRKRQHLPSSCPNLISPIQITKGMLCSELNRQYWFSIIYISCS